MKIQSIRIIPLFLLLGLNICYCQYEGDKIFDDSYVHTIEITSSSSIDQLYSVFLEELFISDYTYALASIAIDGIALDSVGIRVKGGISSFDIKKPLKIDFNEFVVDRRFDGLKKINLHQGNMDPSFVREKIAYDLFRDTGVKTVRTSFAKVFYNGVYEGVYTIVQQVDDEFIHNHFASKDGALYKTGINGVGLKYEVDDSFTYSEFTARVDQIPLDSLHIELPKILDVKSFMRFIITEIFINSVDSPLTVPDNFYIYYEPKSKKYTYIPWDYNLSLYDGVDHTVLAESTNIIFNKIKSNEVLMTEFLGTFCELLEYSFVDSKLNSTISNYENLLAEAILEDPYMQSTNFIVEVNKVKELISDRFSKLSTELNSIFPDCDNYLSLPIMHHDIVINEIMASSDSLGGVMDLNGGYPDWIELYNNTTAEIQLEDYYLTNDSDFKKHWVFPDEAILGGSEYMIVWADRDMDEDGLHADFKLNKEVGQILLTHKNGNIIDSMSYTNQETNVSFARIPNGNGEFLTNQPTFNGPNVVSASTQEDGLHLSVQIYPNPARDNIVIKAKDNQSTFTRLYITDNLGNCVLENNYHATAFISISTDKLPKGVNTITLVDSSGNVESAKIIVL